MIPFVTDQTKLHFVFLFIEISTGAFLQQGIRLMFNQVQYRSKTRGATMSPETTQR